MIYISAINIITHIPFIFDMKRALISYLFISLILYKNVNKNQVVCSDSDESSAENEVIKLALHLSAPA